MSKRAGHIGAGFLRYRFMQQFTCNFKIERKVKGISNKNEA